MDYWQRLSQQSLYSLEKRRQRYLIIYALKIINGEMPISQRQTQARHQDGGERSDKSAVFGPGGEPACMSGHTDSSRAIVAVNGIKVFP